MSRSNDPYGILGIAGDASVDDIKAAYRDAAKRYHPDVARDMDAEQAARKFDQARQAYMTALRAAITRMRAERLAGQRQPLKGMTPDRLAGLRTTYTDSAVRGGRRRWVVGLPRP